MMFYDLSAKTITGEERKMDNYKGKVLLVVNTASKCGLTYQLKDLEEIFRTYNEKGLEVLGFPCNQFANQESGNNDQIHEFCQRNYGVSFDMFEKIEVNGENAHPVYSYLKNSKKGKGLFNKDIKWNFTKFLIDKNGNVVKRYSPTTKPNKIIKDLEKLLEL